MVLTDVVAIAMKVRKRMSLPCKGFLTDLVKERSSHQGLLKMKKRTSIIKIRINKIAPVTCTCIFV
jgi:hypothetical protein